MNMPLCDTLSGLSIPFAEKEPMKNHTTFQIGGEAQYLITPRSVEELAAALAACRAAGQEPFLMGHGSNLLVSDAGIHRPVILLGEDFSAIRRQGNDLICEAGALLTRVCTVARQEHLGGMEWAYGIPGTLGGGVFMNAGAYGGEMKDIVTEVTYIDPHGRLMTVSGAELDFGYRHSCFEGTGSCIVEAVLHLTPCPPEEIRERMEDFLGRRKAKQPLEYPSAGSTFKRPQGNYASALIDQCGLKGFAVGGAAVSEKHAGFVINRGGATAADVLRLVAAVQQKVKDATGYQLECEIKIIE